MPGHWSERLQAAVPSRCAVCARWPSQPICAACIARFAQPQPRCRRCALPVPPGVPTCGRCLQEPPPLAACFAAVPYGYPWSGLITGFKFHGQPGWAGVFARLLLDVPGAGEAVDSADLVLPMPLAPRRLAQRGFNQALELARRLAPAGKVDAGLLLRLRETPPQAMLARQERLANVQGAFALEPLRAQRVRGAHVVLVDDVMTSGASVFAAARALQDAGAAGTTAVVLARTDEPGA